MSKYRFGQISAMACAAVGAGVLMSAAGSTMAAPIGYQTAVLADNPYVYYRLGESAGTTADDTSTNSRDGAYVNSPTLGVTGYGTGSDTAAAFSSTSSSYLSTPISTFGSSVMTSSYEFIFKSDAGNFTTIASIFGVLNKDPDGAGGRTNTGAIGIELNAAGVNGTNTAGTARLWLRDEDSNQLWANFSQGSLLDGNYHHLAITINGTTNTDPVTDKVKIYIDGSAVTISDSAESTNKADNWLSLTNNAAIGGRNVRDTSLDRVGNLTFDEAALYTTTLTSTQVAAHAAALTAVPEPAALSLLGVFGLGFLRRRRAC